jgi:beta-N-acetylhexosaminidase
VPATFSTRILGEVLRGDLGFTGVIVSDALDMRGASGTTGIPDAAVRALAAGCDLLCIGTANTDAQLDEIETAIATAISDGRLDRARLSDALSRVAALGMAGARMLADALPGAQPDSEPQFELDRTISAFEVAAGSPALTDDPLLVQLDTTANIAVGPAPWGPAAAGAPVIVLRDGDPLPDSGAQLVVIGRDNHRRDWTRAVIDAARARDPRTVVVDMGWPSADRRYADIATFGASRHVGQALLRWLQSASLEGARS